MVESVVVAEIQGRVPKLFGPSEYYRLFKYCRVLRSCDFFRRCF
nr:MAG TPA: hypothetical protein [Caudoviricetes sp.]